MREKQLSTFFTVQPGRPTPGPAKRRQPSPKPSRHPKLTAVYPHEWEQRKDFYKNTCGSLERHIARHKCEITIATLLQQRSQIFSTIGLTTISGSSLIVTDADGHPLLYFLKSALRWPFSADPTIQGLNALQDFVTAYPPPKPKITDERHNQKDQAQSHGVHHLALWHAIGHEHNTILAGQPTKGAVLSSEMVKVPGYKINAVAEFFRAFTPITQAVGALFDTLDHQNYQRYSELFHRMADDTAASIIRTTSRNCFLGMAVLTGLCCSPHRDSRDTMDGWVADMAFGDFEGGYLEVPQVGLQFDLRPGDVVFMRSALLQHSVSDTTTGLRYGVVYFTHESMQD
jgi:hypothetical protein